MGRSFVLLMALALMIAASSAHAQVVPGVGTNVRDFAGQVADGDWHPAVMAALATIEGGALFPAGYTSISRLSRRARSRCCWRGRARRRHRRGRHPHRRRWRHHRAGLGGRPELVSASTPTLRRMSAASPGQSAASSASTTCRSTRAEPARAGRESRASSASRGCASRRRPDGRWNPTASKRATCTSPTALGDQCCGSRIAFTGDTLRIYCISKIPGGACARNVLHNVGIARPPAAARRT